MAIMRLDYQQVGEPHGGAEVVQDVSEAVAELPCLREAVFRHFLLASVSKTRNFEIGSSLRKIYLVAAATANMTPDSWWPISTLV